MPVQEMPRAALPAEQKSLWPAIHRSLLELVKQHRSTLIFVNSRGLAERPSSDLNELRGENLVLAHHGAIARERRVQIDNAIRSLGMRGRLGLQECQRQ